MQICFGGVCPFPCHKQKMRLSHELHFQQPAVRPTLCMNRMFNCMARAVSLSVAQVQRRSFISRTSFAKFAPHSVRPNKVFFSATFCFAQCKSRRCLVAMCKSNSGCWRMSHGRFCFQAGPGKKTTQTGRQQIACAAAQTATSAYEPGTHLRMSGTSPVNPIAQLELWRVAQTYLRISHNFPGSAFLAGQYSEM